MAQAKLRRWTLQEFLAWEERQDARYELVDGQPVMMAGGSQVHNAIARNLLTWLDPALRGSRCRPYGSDMKTATDTGNVRYPDATVDCGPFQPNSTTSSEPTGVFEVLSKSTVWTDMHAKLRDYNATPTIRHYVLVSQDKPYVVIWSRVQGRLAIDQELAGLDDALALPAVGISLPMAAIYRDLEFAETESIPPGPSL